MLLHFVFSNINISVVSIGIHNRETPFIHSVEAKKDKEGKVPKKLPGVLTRLTSKALRNTLPYLLSGCLVGTWN